MVTTINTVTNHQKAKTPKSEVKGYPAATDIPTFGITNEVQHAIVLNK